MSVAVAVVAGGFTGGVPGFPGAGGPIGWQTYQPVTQLWLYKYYGQLKTMSASYEQTYAFVQMLEASAADPESTSIDGGLGDWMCVPASSTARNTHCTDCYTFQELHRSYRFESSYHCATDGGCTQACAGHI